MLNIQNSMAYCICQITLYLKNIFFIVLYMNITLKKNSDALHVFHIFL